MFILYEHEVNENIGKLDDAWKCRPTFVFMADKSGVSEEWVKKGLSELPNIYHNEHFILLTSGSTGQPKLIVGNKKRSEQLAYLLHELQESEPVKTTVVALPLIYCYTFVNQWLWARVKDRNLVLTSGLKQPDVLCAELLCVNDAMLCLTGSQVSIIKNTFKSNEAFPGIIRLHFAGGQFPQQDIETVKRIFPNARIFNNYGCAEAMPRLTLRPLEVSNESSNIGKPLPGVEMKTGKLGEILFRSKYRGVCFYDTNGLFTPKDEDWMPSGDLGEKLENGYWKINGRNNEVFKRYGEKISLLQLLNTVHSRWNGAAVFYKEKDRLNEEGHVLVISPHPNEVQTTDVLQSFRKNYTRPHWPIRFESVDVFPLLPNGKVDKMGLAKNKNKIVHWEQRG
jgi:acyl-CoA synthetase (AMP-forming)/AMP-acid ligase II